MNAEMTNSGLRPGQVPGSKPTAPAKLSEEQFLNHKLDEARQAMSITMGRLRRDLRKGTSPRSWAREHPLVVLGTSAIAGLFAVRSISRHRNRSRLEVPVTSDKSGALNGDSNDFQTGQATSHVIRPRRTSLSRRLLVTMRFVTDAVRLLRPVLISFMNARANAAARRSEPPAIPDPVLPGT